MMNEYFNHNTKLIPGTKARAEDVNARFDGVVTGFARLPAPHSVLKGFGEPITVGAPTQPEHAVTVAGALAGGLEYAADTGVANAYVVSLVVSPAAYKSGLKISFKAAHANTGPSTIDLNGLGIKQLVRSNGDQLGVGDILAGQIITATYDGTKFYGMAAMAGQFVELRNAVQQIADQAEASADAAALSEGVATTKASEAMSYRDTALSHRNAAEGFKDIAVSKASEAGGYRDTALAQAGIATTKASEASASAAIAIAAPGTSATSTTSLVVGTGEKYLTIQTGKSLTVGMAVLIARTSAPSTIWMHGVITAYNSGTGALSVSVGMKTGTGTYGDWTVSLTAPIQTISPEFTGIPTAPTAAAGTNSTQIATTAFTQALAALKGDLSGKITQFAAVTSAELAGKVTDKTGSGNLVFSNSPTLVSPDIGAATGQSFNGITGISSANPQMDGTAAPGASAMASRADHVHPSDTAKANLASPALTGTPTAPTASTSDISTRIATTAFVDSFLAQNGKTIKNTVVLSTNGVAVEQTLHILTANCTLTLQAAPPANTLIAVANKSGTTTCVIARNGQKINGIAEDLVVDVLDVSFFLFYSGAAYGWMTI